MIVFGKYMFALLKDFLCLAPLKHGADDTQHTPVNEIRVY
jgi:hypothetical protein